jgi:hypothetical protein
MQEQVVLWTSMMSSTYSDACANWTLTMAQAEMVASTGIANGVYWWHCQ